MAEEVWAQIGKKVIQMCIDANLDGFACRVVNDGEKWRIDVKKDLIDAADMKHADPVQMMTLAGKTYTIFDSLRTAMLSHAPYPEDSEHDEQIAYLAAAVTALTSLLDSCGGALLEVRGMPEEHKVAWMKELANFVSYRLGIALYKNPAGSN